MSSPVVNKAKHVEYYLNFLLISFHTDMQNFFFFTRPADTQNSFVSLKSLLVSTWWIQLQYSLLLLALFLVYNNSWSKVSDPLVLFGAEQVFRV